MWRSLFNIGGNGGQPPTPEAIEFIDPILPDELNMEAILDGMKITMHNGTIRTAIERVAEAMRPFILLEMLDDFKVDPKVMSQSKQTFKSEKDRLPCTRLLREAEGDHALAVDLSLNAIAGLVQAQYVQAMKPQASPHPVAEVTGTLT